MVLLQTLRKAPKGDGNGSSPKTMTTTEIIKSPGVSRVLFIYTFTMLLALAYTASKFARSQHLLVPQIITRVYGQ